MEKTLINSWKNDQSLTRFFQDGADIIAILVSHNINLSLHTGQVPDDIKLVVSLYKENRNTHCVNYRPVSMLSIMSKILERVAYNQLEIIWNKINNFTNSNQVLDLLFP